MCVTPPTRVVVREYASPPLTSKAPLLVVSVIPLASFEIWLRPMYPDNWVIASCRWSSRTPASASGLVLAICLFKEAIVPISEFTLSTYPDTCWLRLFEICDSWLAAELNAPARVPAAEMTLCLVAESEGVADREDKALKKESI